MRISRDKGVPEPLELKTRTYPGFPTDLQAQMCALLSTAAGERSATEDIFPQRFMHVSELKRMGAKIELDGATAKIRGVDLGGRRSIKKKIGPRRHLQCGARLPHRLQ